MKKININKIDIEKIKKLIDTNIIYKNIKLTNGIMKLFLLIYFT